MDASVPPPTPPRVEVGGGKREGGGWGDPPQSALFVARTPDTREPWYESSPQFRELRPMIRNIKAELKMCFCAAKRHGQRTRPSYGLTKVWPRVPRGINKLVPRLPRGVARSEKKTDKNKLAQNIFKLQKWITFFLGCEHVHKSKTHFYYPNVEQM